ncbi:MULTISPECIES: hypothetical protein [Aeromonas]|uniref:HEAT repeat domain-containing protein n=1 Tax=Aeromonas veronii TaxID=654 RepID=A0A4S5CKD9_AERVE|nr:MULTISPECIES: hypothetical protein [Aeromonas]THJ45083.1 hypothetical protein E8Q35_12950 [Aeromonas veronii]
MNGMHRQQPEQPIIPDIQSEDNLNVRAAIAGNHNTPLSTLAFLSEDPIDLVRVNVALNSNCPVELLERLVVDPDIMVRKSAVAHPKVSGSLLESAFEKNEPYMRWSIASNPNCTSAMLERLAGDRETEATRFAVMGNPNAKIELLLQIVCFDEDRDVRDCCRDKLEALEPTKWKESVSAGLSLANAMECSINPDAVVPSGLSLGDTLLSAGLTNIYQTIQLAELEMKINKLGQDTPPETPENDAAIPDIQNSRRLTL